MELLLLIMNNLKVDTVINFMINYLSMLCMFGSPLIDCMI